jgi:AcrR family transcriptional regulator
MSATNALHAETQKKSRMYQPKRGRPTQEQVAAIDAVILRVGCEMFLEQGYAGTAIEAVAATAGVSKGTLYSRYATKADLFRAIATERMRAWEAASVLPPAGDAPLDEQMFRYGVRMLEALRTPEIAAFDRLITNEAGRFPEIAEAFYQQGYVRAITQLATMIDASAADTGRPVIDAQGVAASYIYGLLGWHRAVGLIRTLTREDCAQQVRRLLAIFMGGRATW